MQQPDDTVALGTKIGRAQLSCLSPGWGGLGVGKSDIRWGVEQRLEFIEFRLFWEGHVNRSDLMDHFGVSVNQASSDLNRYIAYAPDNMVYDKSARTYVLGAQFEPGTCQRF